MAKLQAAVRDDPAHALQLRDLLTLAATPNALLPAGACQQGRPDVLIHGEYYSEGIVLKEAEVPDEVWSA